MKLYKFRTKDGTVVTNDRILALFMGARLSWWDRFLLWLSF